MTTDITKKITIRELVAAYVLACDTIRETYAALNEAQAVLDATFNLDGFIGAKITTHGEYQRKDGFEQEKAIAYLRRAAWRFIVERLEIRRVMSAARIRELDERLEKGTLPELTEMSAFDFADEYTRDLDKIFVRAGPRGLRSSSTA